MSILPRLDSKGALVTAYNNTFCGVAREEDVAWMDVTASFPLHERRLWAADGLHLSECSGVPRLMDIIRENLHH